MQRRHLRSQHTFRSFYKHVAPNGACYAYLSIIANLSNTLGDNPTPSGSRVYSNNHIALWLRRCLLLPACYKRTISPGYFILHKKRYFYWQLRISSMTDFSLYFQLGWQHICNWEGYDHILFVTVLCGTYLLADWRKVLVLVTAFTIGHSITLALSVLNIIHINTSLIEFLIPVTIVFTSLVNVLNKKRTANTMRLNYSLALFFGLIHGMGFSNYLKSLLGSSSNITAQLFAFNLGLEFGQVLIVISALLISYLLIKFTKTPWRDWTLFLSSAIFGIAFIMCIERFFLIKFR